MNRLNVIALTGLVFLTMLSCKETNTGPDYEPETEESHGLRLENMDTTVSPREDFFRYVNGTYVDNTEIPASETRWGIFSELRESNEKLLKGVLEKAAGQPGEKGSTSYKLGIFYQQGMDTLSIESAGISPLQPYLDRIDGIESNDELASELAFFHSIGVRPGFNWWAGSDKKNSKMNIANLYQGGLGLPDRDYYLEEGEEKENIRMGYVDLMEKMFVMTGMTAEEGKVAAGDVMKIETNLATNSLSRVERRDPEKTYNKMTLSMLAEKAPEFDWEIYFEDQGLENLDSVNVGMPDFMKSFGNLVQSESVQSWKNYIKWNLIRSFSGQLSSEFVNARFEFYGKILNGQEIIQPRWKRVGDMVEGKMGELLGQLYVKEAFPPEAKDKARELVDNLMLVMGERLGQLEWMSPETRKAAVTKLEAITVKIGYPDKWKDYSGLEIDGDKTFIENYIAAGQFRYQEMIDKVGKEVDPEEWGMSPQTVNAYYSPSKNEIVFPAGILQPPFFDAEVDDALNYGAIGAVIGHELTHAFDDQGSKFDEKGNMRNWWTDEDKEAFTERAQVVIDQYDAFVLLDSLHVNGQLTLGENIADIDGLRMALRAFRRSQETNPTTEKIQGYTAEQRFFLSFGTVWCGMRRPEAAKVRLKTDPHSPPEFRVKGVVSNMPEFYEAFGVVEGDPLFRPEDQRANIW